MIVVTLSRVVSNAARQRSGTWHIERLGSGF